MVIAALKATVARKVTVGQRAAARKGVVAIRPARNVLEARAMSAVLNEIVKNRVIAPSSHATDARSSTTALHRQHGPRPRPLRRGLTVCCSQANARHSLDGRFKRARSFTPDVLHDHFPSPAMITNAEILGFSHIDPSRN